MARLVLSDGTEIHTAPDGVNFECGEYSLHWTFEDVRNLQFKARIDEESFKRRAKEAEDAKRPIDIHEVQAIVAVIERWEAQRGVSLGDIAAWDDGRYSITVHVREHVHTLRTVGEWAALVRHIYSLGFMGAHDE